MLKGQGNFEGLLNLASLATYYDDTYGVVDQPREQFGNTFEVIHL